MSARKPENSTVSLLLAWGLAGLVAGLAYASVTVWWNDSLRDIRTILVFAAWTGAAGALCSMLAGLVSRLLQGLLAAAGRLPAGGRLRGYPLELAAAGAAWLVFSGWLLVYESAVLSTNPRLEAVAFPVFLCLALLAALIVRQTGGLRLPAGLLRWTPAAAAVLVGAVSAALVQGIWTRYQDDADTADSRQLDMLQAVAEREVVLIGLDGADWRRIDPLMEQGLLPNLKRLAERGVRSNLRTFEPTLSPIIWNTIATGMREEKHGIHGFTEVWLPGAARPVQGIDDSHLSPRVIAGAGRWLLGRGYLRQRPVTSRHRHAKAIWNILSDRGLRVGVVGWFASWPSDNVNGYFVSDNNPWRAAFIDRRTGRQTSSVAGVTWPPELLDELAELDVPYVGESVDDILALPVFADLTAEEREDLAVRQPGILAMIRNIYLSDAFATEAGLDLMRRERLNFLGVYLSGIDNFSHRLGRRTGVVDRYYRHVDEVIGRYLAQARENTTIVVVSDHGWEYGDEHHWAHDHAPDGILLMAGGGIRAGAAPVETPSILDVVPTLLTLYGLPASSEMEGDTVTALLGNDIAAPLPGVALESYGVYHGGILAADNSAQLDRNEETLRKLRALGYIQ